MKVNNNNNNNICNTNQYTYLTISLVITTGLLVLSVVLPSTASAFDPNATKYELIKIWGSKGIGDGQFQRPHDLDFGQAENYLYSVDRDAIEFKYSTRMVPSYSSGGN